MKVEKIIIPCVKSRVDIDVCLKNGQAFRWKKQIDKTEPKDQVQFNGFISNYPVKLAQSETELICEYDSKLATEELMTNHILEYFYLDTDHDLSKMETEWKNIKYNHIPGCNVLKQEPFETIISFICSQNNNISRITSMIDKLCETYGDKVEFTNSYTFPKPEKLINSEEDLRNMKFGYRAKYISQTAEFIYNNGGDGNTGGDDNSGGYDKNEKLKWIENLKTLDYPSAKTELLKLPGVGPKVADCIALFSLEKHHVVPIDTHVWQIAVRDFGYKAKGTGKGLSKVEYNTVQDYLYKKWGDYAGWLQQILFTKEINADSPGKRKRSEENVKVETENKKSEKKQLKSEVKQPNKKLKSYPKRKTKVQPKPKTEKVDIKKESN